MNKCASCAAWPQLKDVLTTSGIDIHGYIDAAYSYLSGPGCSRAASLTVSSIQSPTFNVHQAALTVDYLPKEGFGDCEPYRRPRCARHRIGG
jgi:hypothetical protein